MTLRIKHAPPGYHCPFCAFVNGQDDRFSTQDDIVYQNNFVTAFIAPSWWQHNKGHVLVVPNEHYENIYDIPELLLAEVYKVVKKVAIAIRETYGCDGTSTRQHNEPAGDQDVWHFHVHVFPRYKNDKLYAGHHESRVKDSEEKAKFAGKLKTRLDNIKE